MKKHKKRKGEHNYCSVTTVEGTHKRSNRDKPIYLDSESR